MGNVFEEMSMEGRMTVCNLSIEMGARGGMIAPDQKTFDFLEGRLYSQREKNGRKQWLIGKH
jgi:3-isopropylmalate/(R)-2-methylmalate dehydratase large subunit